MTITLTSATLPVFKNSLTNLSHCLNKAAANAEKRGFSPDAFVTLRMAPDMLPFSSQIRIACDSAKNGTARVSGLEAPKFADDETTFAHLQERIHKTLAWLETVPADAFDGREAQEVTFPTGKTSTRTLSGEAYLKHHALPNLFFHMVTAYNLLRQGGVDVGKMDFLVGERT
jgi:hypothetical protein